MNIMICENQISHINVGITIKRSAIDPQIKISMHTPDTSTEA